MRQYVRVDRGPAPETGGISKEAETLEGVAGPDRYDQGAVMRQVVCLDDGLNRESLLGAGVHQRLGNPLRVVLADLAAEDVRVGIETWRVRCAVAGLSAVLDPEP